MEDKFTAQMEVLPIAFASRTGTMREFAFQILAFNYAIAAGKVMRFLICLPLRQSSSSGIRVAFSFYRKSVFALFDKVPPRVWHEVRPPRVSIYRTRQYVNLDSITARIDTIVVCGSAMTIRGARECQESCPVR
jgi:hypothetical protein